MPPLLGLEIGFMHFVIFHFWINYTSDLPVKEEGPPQLGPELRSSHPSVSFPLVKPQSRLLEESKKRRTLLTTPSDGKATASKVQVKENEF